MSRSSRQGVDRLPEAPPGLNFIKTRGTHFDLLFSFLTELYAWIEVSRIGN